MTSQLLADLIVHELCSIPADKWGFFFPAHVALWRFIRTTRPDVLGELSANFTDEPVFRGRGAEWFCGRLLEDEGVLGPVEKIMYDVVDALRLELVSRESFRLEEIPLPDAALVEALATRTLALVDAAVEARELG